MKLLFKTRRLTISTHIGHTAQAHAAEEARPETPRSLSVYSQGSIQASLQEDLQEGVDVVDQVHTLAINNHASLSGEGTWSASRAQVWARLPPPGPPASSRLPKPKVNRG
jgi:hypothetical protein